MAVEIIRRKEGEMSEKQTIRHDKTQVSINDWGHLCVRLFDPLERRLLKCIQPVENDDGVRACSVGDRECFSCSSAVYDDVQCNSEHLIVFDVATTNRIIDFIKKQNPAYDFIQFLKELAKSNGLPF